MESKEQNTYQLGDWLVEPHLVRVSKFKQSKTLRPKEMDLLVLLIEARGEVVTVADIHEKVWSGVAVSNDSIYFSLSQLRKALGDSKENPQFIETIPKRGYRLVCHAELKSASKERVPNTATVEEQASQSLSQNSAQATSLFVKPLILFTLLLIIGVLSYLYSSSNSWSNQSQPSTAAPIKKALPINAIAVLPFEDLSSDQSVGYLANGISTELIRQLGAIQGLRVAARTSAFSAKQLALGANEIGEKLNVGAVVEGSIQVEDSLMRVNVQLVDTNNGFQIWSETYHVSTKNLFDLQDQIGQSIVNALLPELSATAVALNNRVSEKIDPDAYFYYLKGLESLRINSHLSLQSGIEDLTAAIEISPNFVNGLLALAQAKLMLFETGASNDSGLKQESLQHIEKAKSLEPQNSLAYSVEAKLAHINKDDNKCIDLYQTALKYSPNDPMAKAQLASLLAFTNRHRSERLFNEALADDPFNDIIQLMKGFAYRRTGENEKAIAAFRRASQLNPKNPNYHWMLGYHQMFFKGNIREGINSIRKSLTLDRIDPELQHFIDLGLISLGAETSFSRQISPTPQYKTASIQTRGNTEFEYAYDYLLKSLLFISQSKFEQAYQTAYAPFLKNNIRFSHGARDILSQIVADHLLRKGEFAQAEAFLLTHNESLNKVLERPIDQSMQLLFGENSNPHSVFSYLYILKHTDRIAEFEDVFKRFTDARALELSQVRVTLRTTDYLTDAKIHILKDQPSKALSSLEKAVEVGLRINWQLEIENNFLFAPIKNDPRFNQLLTTIKQDMLEQRALMVEN